MWFPEISPYWHLIDIHPTFISGLGEYLSYLKFTPKHILPEAGQAPAAVDKIWSISKIDLPIGFMGCWTISICVLFLGDHLLHVKALCQYCFNSIPNGIPISRYVPVPGLNWAAAASIGLVQAQYWQLMACFQGYCHTIFDIQCRLNPRLKVIHPALDVGVGWVWYRNMLTVIMRNPMMAIIVTI